MVLVAVSVQTAPQVAAASNPTGPVEEVSGPSAASLSRTAAPTEVVSKRTAYSDTYDNHDGTYATQLSTGPINYVPSGSKTFQPIDTTLSDVAGGNGRVRASHMANPVEAGGPGDDAGFLSMDTGSGVISFHLAPGIHAGKSGSKPSRNGSVARLAGLMDNIDLQAVVDNNGVRTFFALNSRPASSSFSLALDTGGLTPSLQADGSISFLDKKGNLAASMPGPYAVDSNIDPNIGSGKITYAASYSLAKSGKLWLLTVSVDPTWLASATYPVYVDPSVIGTSQVWNNTVNNQSALINKVLPDMYNQTGYHEFLVGYDSISQWATYMKFDLAAAGINGYVVSANLDLYPWHQWYTTGERTRIKLVPTGWSTNSLTWNNAPFHSNPYPTEDAEFVGAQGQWTPNASWTNQSLITTWARSWESSPSANYGIYLYGNSGDYHYWKRFTSSQNGTTNRPYLDVTYTVPTVAASSPVGNVWTNNGTVSWSYSNPNGPAQAGSQVQVATDSGMSNLVVNSGWIGGSGTSYAIPASLTNGQTYYWRAAAHDGYSWSPWTSVNSFRWDAAAPAWNGFTGPPANPTAITAASYQFAWNAASDYSGVYLYGVVPQAAPVSSPGVCSTSWSNLANWAGITATSYPLSTLASNTCYRLAIQVGDNLGNWSGYNASNPILVDTATPAAPTVSDNCATIGACNRSGNTIYFQPAAAKTITLTSAGVNTPSGIASSNFGALSAATGWTYASGVVSGNPASKTLTWSAGATQTVTLPVNVTNSVGTNSPTTTLTFVPDPGAKAAFSNPGPVGAPTTALAPGTGVTVAWAETPGLSPITARSLQMYTEPTNADGSCPAGGSWTTQGAASSATGSVSFPASGFIAGSCYRWVQTLTDSLGPLPFTTGSLYVDATAPTVSIAAPAAGQPLSGNVSITGTATDPYFASYTLGYGAGASPSSCTPISSSTTAVSLTGPLGGWIPGPLQGVYTICLTATDTVGNSRSTTTTVYLDNTDRGIEAGATSVPFNLDGGWNLGVNVATGEASLSRDLFSIPSYGPAASLSLTYNSGDTSAAGQLGVGWSSNLSQYLSFESGLVVWHEADGSRVPFGQVAGSWTTLPGRHETLGSGTGTCASSGSTCIVHLKDQSSLTFEGSAQGRLLVVTDRFGKALTISWGSSSATVTDASGRTTTINLDSANARISSVIDSAGRAWSFGYSGTGSSSQLTSLTDPASNGSTFVYTSGLLASVTRSRTPVGGSAAQVVWSIGYSGSQVASVTDPIGGSAHPATFAYGTGTTSATIPGDTSSTPSAPASMTTTYVYDAHGWVTKTTDAAGYVTNATYYASGDVWTSSRQVDQPASHWATTTYEYDAAGNVTKETDPIGTVTKFAFGAANDLLKKSQAYGTSVETDTQYLYDGSGHLCRETQQPTLDITTLTHPCTDALPVANADQNVDKQYTYDAKNELATETDALGVVTSYGYDTYGNQTGETRNYVSGQTPDATSNVTTTYLYDQATVGGKLGLRTTQTNPVGVSTTYAYDVLGNQFTVSLPGDTWVPSQQTANTYDEFNAKVSSRIYVGTGPNPVDTTTTTYNARGWATGTSDANTTATTTTVTAYDLAGDAYSITGTDLTVTAKTYDGLHLLLTEQPAGTNQTSHVYDGLGDERSTTAPATTTTNTVTNRTFDLDGHLLTETIDAAGTPATTTHVPDALGRDHQVTEPAPSLLVTTTTYDGVGRVTRSVAGTSITDKTYTKTGNVLSVTTPYASGATPEIEKNAYDLLGRECRSVGNATTDPSTLAHPCTDPITSDGLHNLVTTTYYDAAGQALASVDPKGVVARSIYDVAGHVAETIANCTDSGTTPSSHPATCAGVTPPPDNATDIVTTVSYSVDGVKVASTTTAAALTTKTTFDGTGRTLSSVVDYGSSPHLNLETDYAYDTKGRQAATKSPTGVIAVTVYDTNGRVGKTIANCTDDPAGSLPGTNWVGCSGAGIKDGTWNLTTFDTYDGAGHKSQEKAPNGSITVYSYDTAGRLITQVNAYVSGQPTNAAGGVNATTNHYYDADGRRIATASPSPTTPGSYVVTRDQYDSAGHVTSEIANCTSSGTTPDLNPAACTGQGTHDATTNIATSYSYDAAGNKTSMTAPSPANGATGTATVRTLYAYDTANRLCSVYENASANLDLGSVGDPCFGGPPVGTSAVVTYYVYDSSGRMAMEILPPPAFPPGTAFPNYMVVIYGQTMGFGDQGTTFSYDAEGRTISQTDGDGKVTSWTYDSSGNKTSQADPDGQHTYWSFDTANRLCARTALPSGVSYVAPANPCTTAASGATVDTLYTHDAAGNVTGATDALSLQAISATLDPLGRPTSVSNTSGSIGDPGTTYTYSFTNPTRTDPSASGAYSFTVDAYGRQAALADPLIHPNGHGFTWTYGPAGKVASQVDPTGSSDATTSDNTTTYAYDALGRLASKSTSATISGVNTPRASLSVSYNNASNLVGQTAAIAGSTANGSTTYSYDAQGRVLGYTPPSGIAAQTYTWNGSPDRNSITTGSTTVTTYFDFAHRAQNDTAGNSYAYDKEGRLTLMPGKTMAYDALGRLTAVHETGTGALLATCTYDPLDRLETITEKDATTGFLGTTSFLYVGLTNAIARTSTTTSGSPTVTKHVTDLSGTELYEFDATALMPVFLGRNAHGDVSFTTDATGAVTARATYDPFGNLVNSSGSVPATRWQSSWQDTATGLYYVIARWYAPSLGAFLSQDPLQGSTMEPQTLDPYAYATGDPMDKIDPTGEVATSQTLWRIAWWALTNAYVPSPDPEYQGQDCANFASHALNNAGYAMAIPKGLISGKSTKTTIDNVQGNWNAWFKIRTNTNAWYPNAAWHNANYLYKYLLATKRGKALNPSGWVVPNHGLYYTGGYNLPAGIKPGDLAFASFTSSSTKTHVMVVGLAFPFNILFAQHDPGMWRWINDLYTDPNPNYRHSYACLYFVEPT